MMAETPISRGTQSAHTGGSSQTFAAVFTDAQSDTTSILGDIEAFLAALEQGAMQAQWEKDRVRTEAWIRDGHLSHGPDASED